MEPTRKSYAINKSLKEFFGVDREDSITNDVCVMCKKPADSFDDELSRKEFSISGLCQQCQNKVFGKQM